MNSFAESVDEYESGFCPSKIASGGPIMFIQCCKCEYIVLDLVSPSCCYNMVCQRCYKKGKREDPRKCPCCSKDVNEYLTFTPLSENSQEIYKDMRYHCKHYDLGCKHIQSPFEVRKHESLCIYNLIRLNLHHSNNGELNQNVFSQDTGAILKSQCQHLINQVKTLEEQFHLIKKNMEIEFQKANFGLPQEYGYLPKTLDYHQHILLRVKKRSGWFCNGCGLQNVSMFSFYCYDCDVDVCDTCISITLMKPANDYDHPHPLTVKDLPQANFACNICKNQYPPTILRYRCHSCDFNLCHKCRFYNQ